MATATQKRSKQAAPAKKAKGSATEKRGKQSDAIVEATLQALRKHGYAATSLARIAEEAGTSKRMVLHYFETREQLFDEVVRSICRRILAQAEQAISQQADPSTALSESLDLLWKEVLADPGLHAVFFGFIAESVTDSSLRSTIAEVRGEYRDMIARLLADSRQEGRITKEVESLATLILSTIAGLTIDFLERGDTPALQRAFGAFKDGIATAAEPA